MAWDVIFVLLNDIRSRSYCIIIWYNTGFSWSGILYYNIPDHEKPDKGLCHPVFFSGSHSTTYNYTVVQENYFVSRVPGHNASWSWRCIAYYLSNALVSSRFAQSLWWYIFFQVPVVAAPTLPSKSKKGVKRKADTTTPVITKIGKMPTVVTSDQENSHNDHSPAPTDTTTHLPGRIQSVGRRESSGRTIRPPRSRDLDSEESVSGQYYPVFL